MRLLPLVVAFCLTLLKLSLPLHGDDAAATAHLYDPQRIIDVQIRVPVASWNKIRKQTRSFFVALQQGSFAKSPFKYVRADVTVDGKVIKNVGLRKKGFLGSLDEERPSLKIKFDKYQEQAPFGALSRLTLNNNKQDPSCLSQFLSYKLFNESGTVASRCNLAHVTVNGNSLGIYSNVESMGPALLQRRYGDGTGRLFEGTVVDFVPESVSSFEPKSGGSQLETLKEISTILGQEPLDLKRLEQHIDLPAFYRFWAMESLIGFWDGYAHNQNNYFVYQHPQTSKHYFMPWGTDSAFTSFVPRPIQPIRIRSVHTTAALPNLLYRYPRSRARYRDTLKSLLEKHWREDKLLAEVDRVERAVNETLPERNRRFQRDVERVRRFIRGRRRTLDRELARWPIKITKGPRQPPHIKVIGRGQAAFKTAWFDRPPKDPAGEGEVTLELELDGKPVKFRKLGATAGPDDQKKQQGPPATLVFHGVRENGRQVKLALEFPPTAFQVQPQPIKTTGVWIEGSQFLFLARAFLNPTNLTLVDGRVTLVEAAKETGAPVRGRVKLQIVKFAGGEQPRAGWTAD